MPVFIAALLGGLVNIAASVAGRVLLALGFGIATYAGISTSLDWLLSQFMSNANALPLALLKLMALMKVGECVSVVTSAITVRLVLDGLTNGSITRLVQR